mmetsp:Transcript_22834/g.73421  ORF Transcript_22834/g.73421 Transcript_22834/m.73421 type:complete len:97 (-) Transcript_22834:300-590(-)
MSAKLKEKLEADADLAVTVSTLPVDPNPVKLYKIEIDGAPFFSWQVEKAKGPPPEILVAPNDKWKTPVNFETHHKFFGEEKPWQVDELKAAIKAKM